MARTGPRARVSLLALDMMTIPTSPTLLAVVSCLSLFKTCVLYYYRAKRMLNICFTADLSKFVGFHPLHLASQELGQEPRHAAPQPLGHYPSITKGLLGAHTWQEVPRLEAAVVTAQVGVIFRCSRSRYGAVDLGFFQLWVLQDFQFSMVRE